MPSARNLRDHSSQKRTLHECRLCLRLGRRPTVGGMPNRFLPGILDVKCIATAANSDGWIDNDSIEVVA
jgi:hypothetical protein